MGLRDTLRTWLTPLPALNERAAIWPGPMTGVDNYWPWALLANGQSYPLTLNQTLQGTKEEIEIGRAHV